MKGIVAVRFFSLLTVIVADQIKLKAQPLPDDPTKRMIWFNTSTFATWSHHLDNYLEVYRRPELTEGRSNSLVTCDHNIEPSDSSVCQINIDSLHPCVPSYYFGYKTGDPCVFFEIEKVVNWKPKYYNGTKYLPKGMPQRLKDQIEELTTSSPNMWQTVWLSCEGETPVDKENIGPIKYIPVPGFFGYYYPYTGQKGYLSPLVAIHLEKPQDGVVISIECKLWAPGISHNANKELGMIRFELLVDV